MFKNLWKKLGSREVYKNKWLTLREDKVITPDGKKGIYSVIKTHPSVYTVALNKKNEFVLIGQFRYTTNIFSWELPAGGSNGEDILQAAKRELREEAGLTAKYWEKVGDFQAMNGIAEEIGHVFIAKDLLATRYHAKEEEGITKVKTVTFSQAFALIATGEISDAQSIAAITKSALFLKNQEIPIQQ